MTITVSTDGSALGNPNGPMGWAWADHASNAARTQGHQHDGDSDAGGATNGTNQIGELCAVLEALRAHRGPEPLTIETDSQYAINCSTTWVKGWKKNGWKNSQKKPVKNAPLIKAIDAEIGHREGPVKFVWVKGHNGNPGNEKVNDLAHTYSGDARSGVKDGYLPLEGWQSLLASPYAKGVDIPADAKMLIDGKITEEQYHLGRGAESSDNDSDDWDDSENHEKPTTNSSHNAEANNDSSEKQIANGKINETGHANSQSAHKPTLSERLAEPEGVPEYDFSPRKPIVAHHRAAENDEAIVENNHHEKNDANEDKAHGIGRTVRSHPDFSAPPVGDDITIPEDRNDSVATETQLPVTDEAAPNGTGAPSQSQNPSHSETEEENNTRNQKDSRNISGTHTIPYSENSRDDSENDTEASSATDSNHAEIDNDDADNMHNFNNQSSDGDSAQSGQQAKSAEPSEHGDNSDNVGDANASDNQPDDDDTRDDTNEPGESDNGNADETAADTETAQHAKSEPKANQAPPYLPSGLNVSGPLRFFPAPQTSPTYNGRPRHIRGVIAIDGYVAGDGSIVLSNAPFLIANNKHKK